MFKIILFIFAIIVIVVLALSLIVIIKPYTLRTDTITLFTGGCGSGKSFYSTKIALIELKKARFRTFIDNFNPIRRLIRKKPKIPRPHLYSSIPVRVSPWEMSRPLDFNPFVLQERFPQRCVVFIDEINLFLSQMDFKIACEDELNEAITLFRHNSLGGRLIANTQSLNKVAWFFRYCSGNAYNLSQFRKPIFGLPILAWCKVRNVTITDDIKSVETGNAEDNSSNLFCFFPLRRSYDTYAYSERYNPLPMFERSPYTKMKRKSTMKFDTSRKYPVLVDNTDEYSGVGVGTEQPIPPDNKQQKKPWKRTY